jgi:hypothetical protein
MLNEEQSVLVRQTQAAATAGDQGPAYEGDIIIDDQDALGNNRPIKFDPNGPLYKQKVVKFTPENIYLKITLPGSYNADKEYVVQGSFRATFAGLPYAALVAGGFQTACKQSVSTTCGSRIDSTYITGVSDVSTAAQEARLRRLMMTRQTGNTIGKKLAEATMRSKWSELRKSAMQTRAKKILAASRALALKQVVAVARVPELAKLPGNKRVATGDRARAIVRKMQTRLLQAADSSSASTTDTADVKIDYQLVFPSSSKADAAAALINNQGSELAADMADALSSNLEANGVSGVSIVGIVMERAVSTEQEQGAAAAAQAAAAPSPAPSSGAMSKYGGGMFSVLSMMIGAYALLF